MLRKIYITLSEDKNYRKEISREATELCGLLKEMIIDDDDDDDYDCVFPLSIITPKTMDKILIFLDYHKNNPMMEISLPVKTDDIIKIVGEWDANFITLDEPTFLIDIITAANYIDCNSLLQLSVLKFANIIKNNDIKQIKEIFNINTDITPENEQEIHKNNPWIFDIDNNV